MDTSRGRRRRGRRKGQQGERPAQAQPVQEQQAVEARRRGFSPANDPARFYMPPPPPPREYEPDPVTGATIENPLTAIAHPQTGKPMNIETVLDLLRQQEQLEENQELAYIGAGAFGILEEKKETGRKTIEVVKKIPYEDTHEKYQWRRELSPGISRDYIPQPEPLDRLYTTEEIQSFPRLGAAASAFLSQNNN